MKRRYAGPIQSNPNGSHHTPSGRPYDRIRDIVARAKAGTLAPEPRPRKKTEVNISDQPEPRENALRPTRNGEIIAARLLAATDPLDVQLTTTDNTQQSLSTAQEQGKRWLDRTGNESLRLSYRRDGDKAIWVLAPRINTRIERTEA